MVSAINQYRSELLTQTICGGSVSIQEIESNEKILLKVVNILGQETKERKNIPLFYIYDNGTVEKRIILE